MFEWNKSILSSLVPSPSRKTVRVHGNIWNPISDELHLFEYKDRIGGIEKIQQKLKPVNSNNINFIIHKCNEKLIIQSTDIFVQYTTS